MPTNGLRCISVFFCACAVSLFISGCNESNSSNDPTSESTLIFDELSSNIVGDSYPLRIYWPNGVVNDHPRPVIYVLDGETHASAVSAIAMNNNINAMIVGIGNNIQRRRDYVTSNCNAEGGGHEAFFDFIRFELIPYIDATYATDGQRVLLGHSFGGVFVMYSMFSESPDDRHFSGYVASDPSLWCDEQFFETLRDDYADSFQGISARLHLSYTPLGNAPSVEPYGETLQDIGFTNFPFEMEEYIVSHSDIVQPSYENGIPFVLPTQINQTEQIGPQ